MTRPTVKLASPPAALWIAAALSLWIPVASAQSTAASHAYTAAIDDRTPPFADAAVPEHRANPLDDSADDELTDHSFLALIAQNSIEAIAVTAAAQQRCQRPELRELAAKLGADQQLSLRKIREIAEVYGIDLQSVADQHLPQTTAVLDAIADREFDSSYIEFMRINQAAATRLLQHAAAETRLSADMRTLANNLMSVVWAHRHHIHMAINTLGMPRQEISLRM